METRHPDTPDRMPPPGRRWERYILAPTLLLVALALGLVPFVAVSMIAEFRGGQDTLYDLNQGHPVDADVEVDPGGAEYLNVAVIRLDEASRAVTLAISGNRDCDACQAKRFTLFALDDDASQRRGFAPFATISVPEGETAFSETVTLPIRGSATRYPFDTYRLRLGLDLPPPDIILEQAPLSASPAATPGTPGQLPAPAPAPPTSDSGQTSGQVLGTLQNQLNRFTMANPVLIATAPSTPGQPSPHVVFDLEFQRPAYLPVLAVLLVVFVAVSSGLTLLTQPIEGLLLGVGGLILAIWGVRSVLVPSWLLAITAVDLTLSGVILVLLIGVAVRAALHLHHRAGISVADTARRRLPWLR